MLSLLQLAEHAGLLGSTTCPQVALHEQDVLTKFLSEEEYRSGVADLFYVEWQAKDFKASKVKENICMPL